jgi:hypothetical protein
MPTVKVPESAAVDRTTIAREQSAMFPTRLAMARWANGGEPAPLHGDARLQLRAAYYAQAQRDFQAWLDRGGFMQYDHEPVRQTSAVNPTVPDGDAQSADCCTE